MVGRAGEPMGLRQLRAMARMRAMVVLPMPRWPLKMYPWAMRSWASALARVTVTWSWPTTSAKRWGRYFRARTW